MVTSLILILVGIVVGIMGAVLGIGGGIIIVPLLTLAFKIPIHEAIATSLIVITANSLSASSVHIKSGIANLQVGLLLSLTAVIGAMAGSLVSVSLSQNTIMLILGCVQIFVAILTYIKTRLTKQFIPITKEESDKLFFAGSYMDNAVNKIIDYKPIRLPLSAFLSIFSGIFSGLAGVGGGLLMIPTMNIASYIPMKAATATSAFIIGFTASAASIIYIGAGHLRGDLVSTIILGITAGTFLSTKFFSKITDKKVSYLLIALLIFVSVQMIYKGLGY